LLENGLANSDDEVATYRGSTLCQSGKVGELAKWTVEETKHGKPSRIFRRWMPFLNVRSSRQQPESRRRINPLREGETAVLDAMGGPA
jgi:hypothetical protein